MKLHQVLKKHLEKKQMYKDKSKKAAALSASFSVEAAYIVPLILLLIFAVVGYTIYFHDIFIADVRAAHLTEEGRMAVEYGKIPFESKLYIEGFREERSRAEAVLLISEKKEEYQNGLMGGVSETEQISLSEEAAKTKIRYILRGFPSGNTDDGTFFGSVLEMRNLYEPQKYSRITTNLYRIAKQLF